MVSHLNYAGRGLLAAAVVAALALAAGPVAAEDAVAEAKVLGNFDEGHAGWAISSDAMMNGTSTAEIAVEEGVLAVSGELKPGFIFPWGGAAVGFAEGPADLSAFKTLNFRVRGDGRTYTVMVITGNAGAAMGPPPSFPFETSEDWQDVELYLSDFGADFSAVQALTFVATETPGPFAFQIDDVELR